jgi:hypothetical protein
VLHERSGLFDADPADRARAADNFRGAAVNRIAFDDRETGDRSDLASAPGNRHADTAAGRWRSHFATGCTAGNESSNAAERDQGADDRVGAVGACNHNRTGQAGDDRANQAGDEARYD